MHLLDSTKTSRFSFLFLAHSLIGNWRLFISPVYLCRETTILSEILHTNVQNKPPKSYHFKNAQIKIGHKYKLNCSKKWAFLSSGFCITKRGWKNHQKYWRLVSNSCSTPHLNNGGTNRLSSSLLSIVLQSYPQIFACLIKIEGGVGVVRKASEIPSVVNQCSVLEYISQLVRYPKI